MKKGRPLKTETHRLGGIRRENRNLECGEAKISQAFGRNTKVKTEGEIQMDSDYKDIINLPHHVSKKRPQMSMIDRAAQFSPFAALTGYDAAIKETGRLTDDKVELDEEALNDLNMRYQILFDKLDEQPDVAITYFKPDETKDGGAYLTITDKIKRIDEYERLITTSNGTKIPMDDVVTLESSIFHSLLLE